MPFKSNYDPLNGMITLNGAIIGSFAGTSSLMNVPEPLSIIKRVIFHDPATIIYWSDGTKTVVKCKNEEFDKEKGLAMACMKKLLGNKGHYYEEVKKWTKEETNND